MSYFGRANQQIYEVCFLDDLCIYKHLKLSPISEKYARKLCDPLCPASELNYFRNLGLNNVFGKVIPWKFDADLFK